MNKFLPFLSVIVLAFLSQYILVISEFLKLIPELDYALFTVPFTFASSYEGIYVLLSIGKTNTAKK